MNPKQYRARSLAARDSQCREEIRKKSEKIHSRLSALKQIQQAEHIFTYLHFRSEVETQQLVDLFLKMGKTVSVPLCHQKTWQLDAIQITDPKRELIPGTWGILEPLPQLHQRHRVDSATIDLLLMPGAVFDVRGGRYGYGGGFYDRFISAIPKALRIALSFQLQLVEQLPLQAHDELVDIIVTEEQVINCKRGKVPGKDPKKNHAGEK